MIASTIEAQEPRRISSGKTFYYKRLFPIFWFGGVSTLGVLFAISGLHGRNNEPAPVFVYFVPVIMLIFGYVLCRFLVFDLMDEVYDQGDCLIVKNKNDQDRIDLSNIINISYAGATNPRRATLTLREPCKFGKKIAFSPKREGFFDLSLTSNKVVDDLIERVDTARTKTYPNRA